MNYLRGEKIMQEIVRQRAYDLDFQDEKFIISLYSFYDDYEKINGNIRSFRCFELIKKIETKEISYWIEHLKAHGFVYLSVNNHETLFDLVDLNPLLNLKLLLLSRNSFILQKVFDESFIQDNKQIIKKYIHYVDVNTGKEYMMDIGQEEALEQNIMRLKNEGFVAIDECSISPWRKELRTKSRVRIKHKKRKQ